MPAMFFCEVTLIFDLLTPKIIGFPWTIVEHVYVKFGDPSWIGFEISCGTNRQTDKQTNRHYRRRR